MEREDIKNKTAREFGFLNWDTMLQEYFYGKAKPFKEQGGFDEVINHLMASLLSTVTEWVDVKERLPESDGIYRVKKVYTDVEEIGKYCSASKVFKNYDGYNVTHWMPLPNPLKFKICKTR